ncbi:hypothetical protein B0H67DRAFT_304648 [Lasiosphaeris hirsuta]|uniref:Uncharacterized protein n=1 Tax=Lasiosphaeris hirsuta TaxID=260670 RepID=A0AA40DQ46_9PEZI|nr:hypothetical protein B0H67DRAFT_304648 [Lasiosphaeris hirsuta]
MAEPSTPSPGAGTDMNGDDGMAPKTEREIALAVLCVVSTSPVCHDLGIGLGDVVKDFEELDGLGKLSDRAAAIIFRRDGGLSDGEWYRDLKFCRKLIKINSDDGIDKLVADTMMKTLGYNTLGGRTAARAPGSSFEPPPTPPHSPPTTHKALRAFRVSIAAACEKEKAKERKGGSGPGSGSPMDLDDPDPQPRRQSQPETRQTPPVAGYFPEIFCRDRELKDFTYLLDDEPKQPPIQSQTTPFLQDQAIVDPDDRKPQTAEQQRFFKQAFPNNPFRVGNQHQVEHESGFQETGWRRQTAAQLNFSEQAFSPNPFGLMAGEDFKGQPEPQNVAVDPRELELKPRNLPRNVQNMFDPLVQPSKAARQDSPNISPRTMPTLFPKTPSSSSFSSVSSLGGSYLPPPAQPSLPPTGSPSQMDESVSPRTAPKKLIGILSSPVAEPLDKGTPSREVGDTGRELLWPAIGSDSGLSAPSTPQPQAPGDKPAKPARIQKPASLNARAGKGGGSPKRDGGARRKA